MKLLYLFIDFIIITATSQVSLIFMSDGTFPPARGLSFTTLLIAFCFINIFPGRYKISKKRLRILAGGSDLLILFSASLIAAIPLMLYVISKGVLSLWQTIAYILTGALVLAMVFWNGMIRVYMTSQQLGIKLRTEGAVCGMIPLINLIFLCRIISCTQKEIAYENDRETIEQTRAGENICGTKYPLLLVHGVFFRDRNIINYWGRIPEALKLNGAVIYYGNQQSALSIKDSGAELAERIRKIVEETGCEKLNIIAHLKGGLDSRYAVSKLGSDKYVASLTTVNTPHRGCIFVEYLFNTLSENARQKMAATYNKASKVAGDTNPDFLAAVEDLKESTCIKLNRNVPDAEGVYYQSVGSAAKNAQSARFPMDVSFPLVKKFAGENDGLVSVESMKWGENFNFIKVNGKRGVTHDDVIDLNRENIDEFDVREFFVQLVADLKNKGY